MGITQESEIIPRRARDVVIALRLKSKANEVELRGRGGTTRARSASREERRRRTQSRSGSEGRLRAPQIGIWRVPNVSAHELPAGKIVDSRSEATSLTVHRLVSSMRLLAGPPFPTKWNKG